jgi:hypothetical protein
MKKTVRLNRVGIPILAPTEPTQPKPTTGRSIKQNLAVIGTLIQRAVSHDSVISGGVNAE